jgi:chromosome segregation ATPase
MGGSPSKSILISALNGWDNSIDEVRNRRIEAIRVKDEIEQKLTGIRNELKELDSQIAALGNDSNDRNTVRNELLNTKNRLENDLVELEYIHLSINEALEQIDKYNDTQKLTTLFLDDKFNILYSKVIDRQKLKYKDYNDRNRNLIRLSNKLKSKYSNDLRNSEYQDDHNRYFMTLNSIFWWVYYILFVIITYQIIYIQKDITLRNKIVIMLILGLYPLLYRMYDLVIMKI